MNPVGVISWGMTPDSPLRRWRRKQQLTQGQLAKRCGVNLQTVARWEKAEEKGGRKPTGDALLCLMRETKIPAEGLLFPKRYLQQHPEYLQAWASGPRRPGRPKQPPEEGGPAPE
jgi:transcriptional regulator with XRE-family HTH domain